MTKTWPIHLQCRYCCKAERTSFEPTLEESVGDGFPFNRFPMEKNNWGKQCVKSFRSCTALVWTMPWMTVCATNLSVIVIENILVKPEDISPRNWAKAKAKEFQNGWSSFGCHNGTKVTKIAVEMDTDWEISSEAYPKHLEKGHVSSYEGMLETCFHTQFSFVKTYQLAIS